MRLKTVRPIAMFHIFNVYYPMGEPEAGDTKTFSFAEYFDQEFHKYAICYTEKQVNKYLETAAIKVFSPYIPLRMTA